MRSSSAASAGSRPGTRAKALPKPSGGRNSPRLRVSMRRKPAPSARSKSRGAVVLHREALALDVGDGVAAKPAQRGARLGPRHEQRDLQRADARQHDGDEATAPAQRPLEQQPQRRQRQLAVERREVREHAVDGADRAPTRSRRASLAPGPATSSTRVGRPAAASLPRAVGDHRRRRIAGDDAMAALGQRQRVFARAAADLQQRGRAREVAIDGANTRARIIAISGFAARGEQVVVARRDRVESGRARGYPASMLPLRRLRPDLSSK